MTLVHLSICDWKKKIFIVNFLCQKWNKCIKKNGQSQKFDERNVRLNSRKKFFNNKNSSQRSNIELKNIHRLFSNTQKIIILISHPNKKNALYNLCFFIVFFFQVKCWTFFIYFMKILADNFSSLFNQWLTVFICIFNWKIKVN